MALFATRLAAPVDAHERALSEEISRLEKEIAALKLRPNKAARVHQAKLKSRATSGTPAAPAAAPLSIPGLVTNVVPAEAAVPPVPLPPTTPLVLKPPSPTFELGRKAPSPSSIPLAIPLEVPLDPRFNELGVRKFDLGSWWRNLKARIRQHTMGPTSNNPHMIKYLATGSVQGLRPLRYERRVARNRLLALVVALVVVLYGLAWVFLRGGQH